MKRLTPSSVADLIANVRATGTVDGAGTGCRNLRTGAGGE
jgi:hypothetical protein